jgi:phospholipase C
LNGIDARSLEVTRMNLSRRFAVTAGHLCVCILLAACTSSTVNYAPPQTTSPNPVAPALGSYIKHVVVIVQENRSFENMFAGWPGADAPMTGYQLLNGKSVPVKLTSMTYAEDKDMCHLWHDARLAFDGGKMDAFNLERGGLAGACGYPLAGNVPYRYMDHSEIAPYRALAAANVLADHMFPTEFGTSFTAHQDLIAGTTQIDKDRWEVNTPTAMPWGCDAPKGTTSELVDGKGTIFDDGPFPCFTQYPTMANSLDAAKASWKYYAPPLAGFTGGSIWTAFDAIKDVRYGKDWSNVVTPSTKALADFAKGDLPAVTWVIPDVEWADYPAVTADEGPSWVGDLVNAIGKSKNWNSTAIVIVWDDWGGYYDNVAPPQLDPIGLAIRVPCIIVSPYAKHGSVVHTQYEYGSILKFMEEAFNAPSLNTTDARANSLVDSFDFTQKPRSYVPVATKYPPSYFLNQPASMKPPDDY